ncbi:hypothetical protein PTTG_02166 [Puccinia triticina 1-1 BBBD Race 1]|uniref:Uncharacterized protein n=1 Tax=Puccinia triticina (isolate 1-1 / race 1 (BBBD)) TaxID=630390 RepID=A0A180GDW8_PUCT1|nr:hypothetical protein PTTG_02166 [Puccinia triticina 1-1 BBBD Race 1]
MSLPIHPTTLSSRMSGLNIYDTTNSVKAAAQQTASEAGEGSQMAQPQHPTPQAQEPDIDASQPATSSQAPGPNPKPPKAAKAVKTTKPTTRAAAKNNATAPRTEPSPGSPPMAQIRDPEIAEIVGPLNVPLEPAADVDGPVTTADDGDASKEADRETRAILMAQIIKAEKTGDEAKIERYMKMYESVIADQKSATQRTVVQQDNPVIFKSMSVPQKRPAPPGETTQVRNVKFITGRSNSHDDGGFPPYFHKLLLECKGPLMR